MQSNLGRWILRYLVFIGIPYVLAKKIEKFLWNRLDPDIKKELNDKLKKFPEIENISEETRDSLDNRGGANPLIFWLAKVIVSDFTIKSAIVGGVWASLWSGSADNAAANLVRYGGAILGAPSSKFKKFSKGLKRVKGLDYTADILETILDKDLINLDKLELLKIKIEQTLKNLKGAKRKEFIIFQQP